MTPTAPTQKCAGIGRILKLQGFESLAGELQPWRKSDDLEVLKEAKGSALVLPFVKGLRLSAGLIYILRTHLSDTDLEVRVGDTCLTRTRRLVPQNVISLFTRKGAFRSGITMPKELCIFAS